MKRICARLLLLILPALIAFAAEEGDPSPLFYRLHLENDAFTIDGTDRYYTHGTRIDAVYAPGRNPSFTDWFREWVSQNRADTVVSLFLAQYLYTPNDIRLRDPPRYDRPYGGWLCFGMQAAARRSEQVQDVIAVSAGLVGRSSGAEYAQKLIHSVRKLPWPNGWHTQLPNEPVVDTLAERKWKLRQPGKHRWEAIPHVAANLGTVAVAARAGLMLRAGYNLRDDFGFAPIRPAAPTRQLFEKASPAARDSAPDVKWSVHVFAGVEGRFVAHNIFIDGTVFHASRSTKREPWVGDAVVGAMVAHRHLALTYAYVVRTKEFKAQQSNQQFGSLSIDLRKW